MGVSVTVGNTVAVGVAVSVDLSAGAGVLAQALISVSRSRQQVIDQIDIFCMVSPHSAEDDVLILLDCETWSALSMGIHPFSVIQFAGRMLHLLWSCAIRLARLYGAQEVGGLPFASLGYIAQSTRSQITCTRSLGVSPLQKTLT